LFSLHLDGGLRQFATSLNGINEDHAETLADDVSRLSFGGATQYGYDDDEEDDADFEGATIVTDSGSLMTGYKSRRSPSSSRSSSKMARTNKGIVNPFIADLWKSGQPNHRWSCQVHLPSGNDVHKITLIRISTEADCLVITQPKSKHFMDPRDGFSHINMDKLLWDLHPRCVARVETIAKLKGRDMNKELFDEQRIPIPFKARHLFANTENDGDEIFIGKKFVLYDDGEIHLHVEVAKDINDSYKHSPDKPNLERASPSPARPSPSGGIPSVVGAGTAGATAGAAAAGAAAASAAGTAAAGAATVLQAPEQMQVDGETASQAAMPPPPPRQPSEAKVLNGGYEGAATRTRSQIKRRATLQDDGSSVVTTVYEDN
jgi:hypothetical protein